jgi:type I restriction enzyme S subunit
MNKLIPAYWIEVPLEKILYSLESGSRPKGGVKGILKGIPSIGGEHLNDTGGFNFTNTRFIPDDYYQKILKGHIAEKDILIVKDGATTGKVSFIDKSFPFEKAVVNEHVFVLKTFGCLISKFFFYYLWSQEGNGRILENFQGSAQGGINRQFISNTLIPLPPFDEQNRIVTKLDVIIPRIDALKARLEKIPMIIKRFRQSVLTAAVTGKLTEKWREEHPEEVSQNTASFLEIEKYKNEWNNYDFPINWKFVFLRDIADVRLGKMLDGNKNKGELVKYLRNVNVRWFSFNLSDLNEIKISPDEKKKLTIENGDVFICEGGEPGRAAVWKSGPVDMTFQKALHRVRFFIPLISDWLVYNLKVDADSQKLNDLFTGSTIKHFTGRSLALYPMPLPPLEEQKEIVRQVDRLFALADKLVAHYHKARARVEKLSQSVLAKAFRGELVPQDPDDEPAEKLLERIKAEKAKLMGGGRQKTGGKTRRAKV